LSNAQARWALRRSGFLLAAAERFEEGLIAFQSALKTDATDAGKRVQGLLPFLARAPADCCAD
jgi:hypothetical protein